MKIQFDFDNEKIIVEGEVNLGELIDKLEQHLPKWTTWSIKSTEVIYNWSNPYTYPYYHPTEPFIWWNSDNSGNVIYNNCGNPANTVVTMSAVGAVDDNSVTVEGMPSKQYSFTADTVHDIPTTGTYCIEFTREQ